MKKLTATAAATCMLLSAFTGVSSAASMMEMMQCSAACSKDQAQCVMAANQMTDQPSQAMSQIKQNFMASTECGKAAMACQASCK